jgi:holo-[acyl-carrier protein] synthase
MNQADTKGKGVIGTGIDLVENDRMREMLEKWGDAFKRKVFLEREQDYCDTRAAPFRHYAARFAVKEAVSKAFGTGMGPHIGWLDIETVRDETTGAPSVRLVEKGTQLAESMGVTEIVVSLSHTRDYAVAHVLLLGS